MMTQKRVSTYLKPLRIGSLVTEHNLVLAPLAGISGYPFREMCRRFGADLTFTEMVSVDGLLYENEPTFRLLRIREHERPIGFQFFGSDPELFARILPVVEPMKPSLIDLNFGCPVRKVVSRKAGAALLKDLDTMEKIVQNAKRNTALPITAKIRLGWDADSIVVEEAAGRIEQAGADAITVHARTRSQGYSGRASWEHIARVKDLLKIPVIGNGDVMDGISALEMFRTTGADGIMIARGALGRPWIFREIKDYIRAGKEPESVPLPQRLSLMMEHYQLEVEDSGEENAMRDMKKHFIWYTHGLPHSAALRNRLVHARSFAEVKSVFNTYFSENEKAEKMFDYEQ